MELDDLFTGQVHQTIGELTEQLCQALKILSHEQQVQALNRIRSRLHEAGPFLNEPVDLVLWVESDRVQANDYNPNNVAPPEMRLLKKSIIHDGYTQPIVGYPESCNDRDYTVVDGYHRTRVGKEVKAVRERVKGYLPVTIINPAREGRSDRIAATIRHNRARGKHGIDSMKDIVAELLASGLSDLEVAGELGMDADEVLRFKQQTGLPELFVNQEYSKAWE